MRSRVPLQVERIVKTFAAERAQVPLHIRMTLHMSIEKTLQRKCFVTNPTTEICLTVFRCYRRYFDFFFRSRSLSYRFLARKRVLDAVAAVHELQLHLGRQSQLQTNNYTLTHRDFSEQESIHCDFGIVAIILTSYSCNK